MRLSLPSFLGTRNPFDRLRVGLTKGLEVAADKKLIDRGDELDATVTVASRKDLGALEIGLVCTETYEVFDGDEPGVSWETASSSDQRTERPA